MQVRPTTKTERRIIAGLVIFVLGVFAGLAGNSSADPVTKIVTKTVKVPGPTKTVKVPGPTKTVTVTKRVTPHSCVTALDEVDHLTTEMGKVTNLGIGYIGLIGQAYQAGSNGFGLDSVTSQMNDMNSQMDGINRRTKGIVRRYTRAAAGCRS